MHPSIMAMLYFLSLATIITIGQAASQPERYLHNLKVKYYTDVKLKCDHIDLNVSSSNDVRSLRWIFPDGSLVDSQTYLDPKLYKLSGINDSTTPSGQRLIGYYIDLFEIDDDVFGYYTCLVVMTKNVGGISGSRETVSAIRWGLNVNGADFSELLDTYKENAKIGGIAAGVVLVLTVGSFLIWYRFYRNVKEHVDDDAKTNELSSNGIEMQENIGYVSDMAHETDPSGHKAEQPGLKPEGETGAARF